MNVFRHVNVQFRRHWPLFALGVAALLATNWLQQLIPRFLKNALDALQHPPAGGLPHAVLETVLLWAGLRTAAVLGQGFLRYGWRMGFFGLGRKVEYALRRQLFARLLTLGPSFFRRLRVGDLLSRAMSDLATVRESLGFGWLAIVDGLSMIAFTGWFMLRTDARLSLVVLAPLVLIPPLVMTLGRRVRENARQAQALLDALSQTATESFSGARVIHAYARQEAELARFHAACAAYRSKNLRLVRLEAVYWPLLTLVAGMSELLLFFLGGRRVAAGTLTLGDFAMLQDYLLQIVWPVMALGFSTNMYVRGKVSVERLNEVLDAEPEIKEPAAPVTALPPGAALLTLQDVGFRYGVEGPWVLRGVNLELKAGEWVGLAGRTGAGKSSLLRLLPRLEDPGEGRILLWGRDLRDWDLKALRRRVALVAQEPFLFSESVLENAAFAYDGDPHERFDDAVAACKLADFHEVAVGLPWGYESRLGEKGVNLSGGQKQRLALARALFVKPDLLLLDDAFSAVDTATEARIVAGLRRALPETAVLLVSHRVSTLRLCARVLILEDGRVTADAGPNELLQQEGFFFEMARREQLAARAGLEAG
jgi:ATP-binding cassette subfamily B protein